MTTKHTLGPWKILKEPPKPWKDDPSGYGLFITPRNRLPTLAYITHVYNFPNEMEANAKLIAAAPDLLEACQYVVNWHRENDSGEGELFGLDFVTTCISAIRKAGAE